MTLSSTLVCLACVATVSVVACNEKPEPPPSATERTAPAMSPAALSPPAPSVPAAQRPASADLAIDWKAPDGWRRVPKENAMRKATYAIPKAGADSEDAELAVFYFGPNSGGGIEPNIERWIGQFSGTSDSDVRRSERNAGNLVQHLVEIESGTFSSGMPGGPRAAKKNYGLLAAIVETSSGHYFFKITGPSETVKQSRDAFLGMLDSIETNRK